MDINQLIPKLAIVSVPGEFHELRKALSVPSSWQLFHFSAHEEVQDHAQSPENPPAEGEREPAGRVGSMKSQALTLPAAIPSAWPELTPRIWCLGKLLGTHVVNRLIPYLQYTY